MTRMNGCLCIRTLLIIGILVLSFVRPYNVHAQQGTVITIKTITPTVALPGQTMTVKINITVSGGGGGGGGPIDTILAIDRTGSMFGQKFEDAKDAAQIFISEQKDQDRSEIIAFAEQATVQMNFTYTDSAGKAALNLAIDQIISPYGFTNLYGALEKSVSELTKGRMDVKRAIILMTDGRPTIGVTATSMFVDLARYAASTGAVVYTIGLGDPGIVADPVNTTLLQDIATAGNGKYYFAPTSSELANIYIQISGELHGPPATNVRVTENLPTSLVTYNNDATQTPTSISSGIIFWQIPLIAADTSWVVTFTVTAQKRVTAVQGISPTTIVYDRAGAVDIRIDLPPGFAIREVATISMSSSATTVTVGDVLSCNATVANYGTMPETFTVGMFANTTRITTTSVSLANRSTTMVNFMWNTTGTTPGRYNISIIVDPDMAIVGDDPSNNTKSAMLNVMPKSETSILPLIILIMIPFAIIPLVAAALLGRRRGYFSGRTFTRTTGPRVSHRSVCPRCGGSLTYYANYQKWYCQYCRRYV
jgi:uncharacterized protein YegL